MHTEHFSIGRCTICSNNNDLELLMFNPFDRFPHNFEKMLCFSSRSREVSIRKSQASEYSSYHENKQMGSNGRMLVVGRALSPSKSACLLLTSPMSTNPTTSVPCLSNTKLSFTFNSSITSTTCRFHSGKVSTSNSSAKTGLVQS